MTDRLELLAVVALGFLLDQVLGDPHWLYHPVRLIGAYISFLEKGIRKLFGEGERALLAGGVVLVVLVTGTTAVVSGGILYACGRISPWLRFLASVILCYQLFAVKSLKDESMKVYRELKKDDLEAARYAVSMIVGRDTKVLDMTGVTKAAVETVAENTSDGVAAPLFYMAIGGPVLGWVYKAVNTMDSMVGYKNDKYMYFGRFAAKMDDVFNYIPARIGGCLMVVAAGAAQICERLKGTDKIHYSIKNAWKIYKRDKNEHSSPNAAQTEAACAGALMVALSGDNYYFGRLVKKPQIGDDIRELETEDIKRSNVLLYITAFLMVVMVSVIRLVLLLQAGF